MIVSRRPEGLLLVRQVDHQEQCGAMAAAWGNADFARPEPYAPLVMAAAVHDEGWRAWEAAPQVGEGGAPVDFPQIDRPTHVALYREGIEGAIARDPRAGLVVSMHGRGLYEGRLGLDPGRRRRAPSARPPCRRSWPSRTGCRTTCAGGSAGDPRSTTGRGRATACSRRGTCSAST